ncbi:hypothetical protein RAS1_22930 [Phycisphaerae bacterium RAS1]|nr:hypothetical protein RAS1_22930 [Phycisphaerae bacterium RAS1]
MRAIVRYSVEGEQDEQLNNRLRETPQAGFVPNLHVTATYEHNVMSGPQLALAMLDFWHQASNPPGQARVPYDRKLRVRLAPQPCSRFGGFSHA